MGRVRITVLRVVAFSALAACLSAAQTPGPPVPAAPAGAVVGACHVSPIVADLDRSARFYHDVLGLDLVPTPGTEPLPWDTDPGHLNLHGLPVQDPGSFRLQLTVRDLDAALAGLKNAGSRVISTGGVPVCMTFGNRPWRVS